MKIKEKNRFILCVAGCLVLSIVLGFLLLVGAYLLPTEKMRENVMNSSQQVSTEGGYYQWAKGYKNAQTDTYTDASLFLNAIYPGSGNPVKDAMNAPRILYGEDNNEESLVLLSRGEKGETHEVQYGRYWHGSLIFFKPMLLLFDLADIRMISMILQTGLLFLVIAGFVKRNLLKPLAGLFAAVILLNPVTMVMGFCFSVEYILMLIMTAVVLFYHEKLKEGYRYYLFFLMNGVLFVYFNELSFPMVGLGIPLITCFLLGEEDYKGKLKKGVAFSAMWGIGYTVVWMGKWILAWLFTGFNYFKEALEQATRYTSDQATWEVEDPSVLDRIMKNMNVYMEKPYLVFLAVLLTVAVIFVYKNRSHISKENLQNTLPYLLMVIFPFAVFVALGNGYSYVHYWFTHRLLAISAFAAACVVLQLVKEKG